MVLFEIGLAVGILLLMVVIYKLLKNAFMLAVNSVIGLFALMGYNLLFNSSVAINFWSVIITAIGGIFGFGLVLISHYLGWAF